jgi:hypothetical protein
MASFKSLRDYKSRFLVRLPAPLRATLVAGWVGNAIRGLNWLTNGLIVVALMTAAASVRQWWLDWPWFLRAGFLIGVGIVCTAVIGTAATWFRDRMAQRSELQIGIQARRGMGLSWEPWGVHKILVIRFEELILTNRSDQDMSIEMALLPWGAGVLHVYDKRIALAKQSILTLQGVTFAVQFWPASEAKPDVPSTNRLVILLKDHMSGRKRLCRAAEVFGAWN